MLVFALVLWVVVESTAVQRDAPHSAAFLTVRLKNPQGFDVDGCAGVRISQNAVLTTQRCSAYDLAAVQFETAISRQRGVTKVKTHQFPILQIHRQDHLALLILDREIAAIHWTSNALPDLKQAPIFLQDPDTILEPSSYTSYAWQWTGQRQIKAHRSRQIWKRRAIPTGSLYVTTGQNLVVEPLDAQQFRIPQPLNCGSPLIGWIPHDGLDLPVLLGLHLHTTQGMAYFERLHSYQSFLDAHVPFAGHMHYDPTAHYTQYVEGRSSNPQYLLWWSVAYSPTRQQEIIDAENERLYGGTANDTLARPITGEGYVLEVRDAKHRYGTCLRIYHRVWQRQLDQGEIDDATSFFEWMDFGQGQEIEVVSSRHKCARWRMEGYKVQFCSAEEREAYEVEFVVEDGTIRMQYVQSKQPVVFPGINLGLVFQSEGIFVWDLQKKLYVHRKIRKRFHHSSFVAGEPVYAAGGILTDAQGVLLGISPHSGHYKPTLAHMQHFKTFLTESGADVEKIVFLTTTFEWLDKFADFLALFNIRW